VIFELSYLYLPAYSLSIQRYCSRTRQVTSKSLYFSPVSRFRKMSFRPFIFVHPDFLSTFVTFPYRRLDLDLPRLCGFDLETLLDDLPSSFSTLFSLGLPLSGSDIDPDSSESLIISVRCRCDCLVIVLLRDVVSWDRVGINDFLSFSSSSSDSLPDSSLSALNDLLALILSGGTVAVKVPFARSDCSHSSASPARGCSECRSSSSRIHA